MHLIQQLDEQERKAQRDRFKKKKKQKKGICFFAIAWIGVGKYDSNR